MVSDMRDSCLQMSGSRAAVALAAHASLATLAITQGNVLLVAVRISEQCCLTTGTSSAHVCSLDVDCCSSLQNLLIAWAVQVITRSAALPTVLQRMTATLFSVTAAGLASATTVRISS